MYNFLGSDWQCLFTMRMARNWNIVVQYAEHLRFHIRIVFRDVQNADGRMINFKKKTQMKTNALITCRWTRREPHIKQGSRFDKSRWFSGGFFLCRKQGGPTCRWMKCLSISRDITARTSRLVWAKRSSKRFTKQWYTCHGCHSKRLWKRPETDKIEDSRQHNSQQTPESPETLAFIVIRNYKKT